MTGRLGGLPLAEAQACLYLGYINNLGFRPPMAGQPLQQIHVKLPPEIHQALRVRCAMHDVTIQSFVERLVTDAVHGTTFPEAKS